uniref:subtilisin n=2 Tax=Leptocylindrus danicus TaxID=163516 RepID=A0A7S2LEY7_9STRA|mmetsp:Transcript_4055/g.5880  ORF Transcript_4055/g.5880 Transcript_4055/m.5880 type:complete len:289 (+) Transcript_4055:710-1576(+)
MAGTSVSAAVISGSLALLRQYFVDGWWPSGSAIVSDSFDPSSALLKAVLINSAQSLDGIQLMNGTTYAVADYDTNIGFGRMNLNKSLPVKGKNELKAALFDRQVINDSEEHHYDYTISSGDCHLYEFSATLVWVDPPASSGCLKCLLNDLDLTITSESGETYFANGMNSPDGTNNVERIRTSAFKGEKFTLDVGASNLSTQNQTYALVITDDCSETLSSVARTSMIPSMVPSMVPSIAPSMAPSMAPSIIVTSNHTTTSPTTKKIKNQTKKKRKKRKKKIKQKIRRRK